MDTKQIPLSKINIVGAVIGYFVGDWAGAILVFIIPYKTVYNWLQKPITPRKPPEFTLSNTNDWVMPEAAELAHLNPLLVALDAFFKRCRNDCPGCSTNVPGSPCALVMNIYPSMPAEGVKAYYNNLCSMIGANHQALLRNNELREHEIKKDQAPVRFMYLGTGAIITGVVIWTVQFILRSLAGAF